MEAILHLQGNVKSSLTPLWLVHPISGFALPYLALAELSQYGQRPVYGINSPIYSQRSWCLPTSLDDLALAYVKLLRERVQPQGPYLLGGWSMGGMIAMRMAAILEAQHERVVHVILIDSMNPEKILPFQTAQEHEGLVTLTYDRLVESVKAPGRPSLKTFDTDSSCDSGVGFSFRPKPSNFSSFSSGWDESPMATTSLTSSGWTSEIDLSSSSMEQELDMEDHFPDENYDDSDFDVDNEREFSPLEMLERMLQHISDGLLLLAEHRPDQSLNSVSAPVTLLKCAVLEKMPPTISLSRRQAVQRIFDSSKSGCDLPRLKIMLLHSSHDKMFDPGHVPELSFALCGLLESCA